MGFLNVCIAFPSHKEQDTCDMSIYFSEVKGGVRPLSCITIPEGLTPDVEK